jgi:hypothetical protein
MPHTIVSMRRLSLSAMTCRVGLFGGLQCGRVGSAGLGPGRHGPAPVKGLGPGRHLSKRWVGKVSCLALVRRGRRPPPKRTNPPPKQTGAHHFELVGRIPEQAVRAGHAVRLRSGWGCVGNGARHFDPGRTGRARTAVLPRTALLARRAFAAAPRICCRQAQCCGARAPPFGRGWSAGRPPLPECRASPAAGGARRLGVFWPSPRARGGQPRAVGGLGNRTSNPAGKRHRRGFPAPA